MPGNIMIETNLKRFFCGLILGISMIMHTAAANSDTSEALESLYQMQAASLNALGNYYMFSSLEGDTRYSRKMDKDIKHFEENIGTLTSTGNTVADTESLAKSLAIWQEYKTLLETNRTDILTAGFANARLAGELPIKVSELNNSLKNLYDKTLKDTQYKLSSETAKTRKMGLIIKSIVAEYLSRSTSNVIISSITINEGGIEAQAKIFDKLLTSLHKASESDKRIYKLTDKIAVKWSFIEKSVANYNENSVPFIISTNGDRITKSLKEIGDHFEASMQAKK
jgi:hypothetical protein